jgi:hypothetical protein
MSITHGQFDTGARKSRLTRSAGQAWSFREVSLEALNGAPERRGSACADQVVMRDLQVGVYQAGLCVLRICRGMPWTSGQDLPVSALGHGRGGEA